MFNPICPTCCLECRCIKSGMTVIQTYRYPENLPYALWSADMFQCPTCETRIVSGMGRSPYLRKDEEGFNTEVERVKRDEIRSYFFERASL